MTKLSLIIPCYNESNNLPLLIDRCKDLYSHKSTIEIVIVDNGSEDDTALILDKLTKKLNYIKLEKINLHSPKISEYSAIIAKISEIRIILKKYHLKKKVFLKILKRISGD